MDKTKTSTKDNRRHMANQGTIEWPLDVTFRHGKENCCNTRYCVDYRQLNSVAKKDTVTWYSGPMMLKQFNPFGL